MRKTRSALRHASKFRISGFFRSISNASLRAPASVSLVMIRVGLRTPVRLHKQQRYIAMSITFLQLQQILLFSCTALSFLAASPSADRLPGKCFQALDPALCRDRKRNGPCRYFCCSDEVGGSDHDGDYAQCADKRIPLPATTGETVRTVMVRCVPSFRRQDMRCPSASPISGAPIGVSTETLPSDNFACSG